MDVKLNFGKQIKKFRQQKGLSQEELAEKLDISQQTLSKIECGKNFLTAETLEKIPSVLGVNICELFKFEEDDCSAEDTLRQIEQILQLIKTDPKKLDCVHNLIREIALL